MTQPPLTIEEINAVELPKYMDGLAHLLDRVVQGGASVNFVAPFDVEDSLRFWTTKAAPGIQQGTRRLWIAHGTESSEVAVAGCVMLDLDMPPNQVHRGEVSKMLVDPAFRRMGLARALLSELERAAREEGRTLLTLDTTTGSAAETLYRSVGFKVVGSLPGFSKAVFSDEFEATTYMYKALA